VAVIQSSYATITPQSSVARAVELELLDYHYTFPMMTNMSTFFQANQYSFFPRPMVSSPLPCTCDPIRTVTSLQLYEICILLEGCSPFSTSLISLSLYFRNVRLCCHQHNHLDSSPGTKTIMASKCARSQLQWLLWWQRW